MSYIGRGLDAISNVEKLDNITFDGSATYALTKSSAAFTPVGANNILISIDGVIQQGNFSVSTTNIVFDWSPTSSNTCNFILHYGVGVLNVPADGSIVAAKMAANSVDSDSYVDGSIDTVHIDALQVTGAKLNTDVISAQTALAVEPADTDEFMVSDAGVLKRIDYSLIKAEAGGLTSQQVFTSSGTWNKPSGITLVKVYVTGGGGGGGWSGTAQYSSGGGGGAGGTAIELIDVSSESSVSVTVGAAASGGTEANWPEGGATSSFGSYCSATGGTRGPYSGGLDAAANGGVGSNGQINLTGGAGEGGAANTSFNNTSGAGGNSFWGGAGAGDLSAVGNAGSHGGGGGGGSSSGSNGESGGNGGAGLVVVEEYK